MSSKVFSATITGFDAQVVEVEVDTSYGLRCFNIVGLPDKAVDESKHRVSTAIKSLKFKSPSQHPVRILVNLAPADLKKQGSLFDLPIALGYLLDTKQINFETQDKIFVGELSLTGELKPIKGAISFAIMAKEKGYKEIILPEQNANEAGLIKGLRVIGANSLNQVIRYLENREQISPCITIPKYSLEENQNNDIDLKYIKGQHSAKRALEITAAGAHNLLMLGPPGTGKTLLAKALITILPKLSFDEAIEVTKIYSISGLLPENSPLIQQRPFRSPHHSSSETSLIGGGSPPRPGEITLAHRGILFLDEFPEFHRDVLESLRQPIEEGHITILRAKYHLSMPSRFTLVAASNPCPCGNYGNPEKICTCSPSQIQKYKRKLTGPLMDRIDVFINVPSLNYEKLTDSVEQKYTSADIRKRVEIAREIQKQRFKNQSILVNSEIKPQDIKTYCEVDAKSNAILKKYVDSGKLSARGYHRVLKLSRTIADLSSEEKIKFDHVAEALMYRIRKD